MTDFQVSSYVGRYRVLGQLASGGMGSILLARQDGPAGFSKTVVLKQIRADLCTDEAFVTMFLEEARIASRLENHPHIVQVFELGQHEGSYFLVMEFIHGKNLRAVGQRYKQLGRPCPWELAAELCAQALEGLHHAHELNDESGAPLGLVHRDVSPDNVLVSFNGAVKVADFGLAKATTALSQTQPGTLKGKIGYMAPEQLRGGTLDRRSDIYALGVVLYELLAGRRPFAAPDEVSLISKVLHDPPAPLGLYRPDLPEPLLDTVRRALEKDADRRFDTAEQMSQSLRELASSGPRQRPTSVAAAMKELFPDAAQQSLSPLQPSPAPSPGAVPSATQAAPVDVELSAGFDGPAPAATVASRSSGQRRPPARRPARGARAFRLGLTAMGVLSILGGGIAVWRHARPRGAPPAVPVAAVAPVPAPAPPSRPAAAPSPAALSGTPVDRPARVPTGHAGAPMARKGWVTFQVSPWARVFWRGREVGMTPMDPLEVPSGTQTFTLRNEQLGAEQTLKVNVPAGGRVTVHRNLLE